MSVGFTSKKIRMSEQDPKKRIHNFNEVALGYDEEQAIKEANRCLKCTQPYCTKGCPVEINIPEFIKLIRAREFDKALKVLKSQNSLPSICGRVCPQEDQCEKYCEIPTKYETMITGQKRDPISIGLLERFLGDYEQRKGYEIPPKPIPKDIKVAIVGSGPAGLTAAADLVKMGYKVTIFESLHACGGVLVYGIPEFRLPKKTVQSEIDYIKSLGVDIIPDAVVGKTISIDDLFSEGYDAVFVGTGAGLPYFMNIPGENLNNIYSANEFLTRVNLMKAYQFPDYDTPIKIGKKVSVIGAGNVAMDSARCALRLGAEEVSIVYRRSKEQMPARLEEIIRAEEEGIEFKLLTNPIRLIGDEKGNVIKMECLKMELGEPDKSGRKRPIPKKGSEFILEVDAVIVAIGQAPNPLVPRTTKGLDLGKEGNIITNDETCKTSREGIFAGGDIATGAATVIMAMGSGKKAAKAIDRYLKGTD
jgi:glutamate synthase (NADPH/NADH) small chain